MTASTRTEDLWRAPGPLPGAPRGDRGPDPRRAELAFREAAAPGIRDGLIAADPEQYFVPRFGGRE